ncbi:hypothetical protein F5Y16DRAFT_328052 [Xylariaceae sp. FL0255]|nr:hypothetical protein F5Y16DRAFT_328052 [Xylariaceae sp. FL0255]
MRCQLVIMGWQVMAATIVVVVAVMVRVMSVGLLERQTGDSARNVEAAMQRAQLSAVGCCSGPQLVHISPGQCVEVVGVLEFWRYRRRQGTGLVSVKVKRTGAEHMEQQYRPRRAGRSKEEEGKAIGESAEDESSTLDGAERGHSREKEVVLVYLFELMGAG